MIQNIFRTYSYSLTSLSASCANDRKDKMTPIIVILFKTLSTAEKRTMNKVLMFTSSILQIRETKYLTKY